MYQRMYVVVQGPKDDVAMNGLIDDLRVTAHNSKASALSEARRIYDIDDRDVDDDHLEAHFASEHQPVRIMPMPENPGALGDLYVIATDAERKMLQDMEVRAGHKWRCPNCSHDNQRGYLRCAQCGTEHPGRAHEGAGNVVIVS